MKNKRDIIVKLVLATKLVIPELVYKKNTNKTRVMSGIHRFHGRPPSCFPSTAHVHQHGAWWVKCTVPIVVQKIQHILHAFCPPPGTMLMHMCGNKEAKCRQAMKTMNTSTHRGTSHLCRNVQWCKKFN
jgi:hypothetical protein